MAEPLTHNLVHFTRYLRAQGLRVVPDTTANLVDAATAVGLEDRSDAYYAFRAVTVSRPASSSRKQTSRISLSVSLRPAISAWTR